MGAARPVVYPTGACASSLVYTSFATPHWFFAPRSRLNLRAREEQ